MLLFFYLRFLAPISIRDQIYKPGSVRWEKVERTLFRYSYLVQESRLVYESCACESMRL